MSINSPQDRSRLYSTIVDEVLASEHVPHILYGSPGQGKTTALRQITGLIQNRSQALQVYMPFDHICFSPQFFDEHAIRICNNSLAANSEGLGEAFMDSVYSFKVEELRPFLALESIAISQGVEIIILIDELYDLSVFKSFPGYREIISYFVERFVESSPLKIIASTSFERRIREELQEGQGASITELRVPPLCEAEIAHSLCQRGATDSVELAREILILSGGNQGYVKALIDHIKGIKGAITIQNLAEGFLPDAQLELKCRINYQYLVSRSRGEGIIRHLLSVLADMQLPNLTAVARRMDRSLGVTKDYLKWLLSVGLVDFGNKRYQLPDKLLQLWIQLYRSGRLASRQEVIRAITDFLNQGYSSIDSSPVDYDSIVSQYTEEDDIKLPGTP